VKRCWSSWNPKGFNNTKLNLKIEVLKIPSNLF